MELVIDIETVSGEKYFGQLSAAMQAHWQHKASLLKTGAETADPAISYRAP